MKWNKCKELLPPISYLESDNPDDPYECYPVLVYSPEDSDTYCVAYLVKEQDENKWSYGDLSWEVYIPSDGVSIVDVELEKFTMWAEIPKIEM